MTSFVEIEQKLLYSYVLNKQQNHGCCWIKTSYRYTKNYTLCFLLQQFYACSCYSRIWNQLLLQNLKSGTHLTKNWIFWDCGMVSILNSWVYSFDGCLFDLEDIKESSAFYPSARQQFKTLFPLLFLVCYAFVVEYKEEIQGLGALLEADRITEISMTLNLYSSCSLFYNSSRTRGSVAFILFSYARPRCNSDFTSNKY